VGLLRGTWRLLVWLVVGIHSLVEWLFGAAVLTITLATLAAIPLLQFLSLGYLLEAGARVARTGKIRNGFIGVRMAARLGGIVVGAWLLMLPLRFLASLAHSAYVIDPGGPVARGWRVGMLTLTVLLGLHIAATIARGGRLRTFLWPLNIFWLVRRLWQGGYYQEARDAVWVTVQSMQLPYYFWLGCRGFMGAFIWLMPPVTLLAIGSLPFPIAPLFGWLGALLLAFVLMRLPLMQMRMAALNRLSAAFEWRAAGADYRRAPWINAMAWIVTLLSALPLYLLKIESVPSEAAWLPSLVFLVFIFPARLLTGWALACAWHRPNPSHWFFRWTGRLPMIPVALFYVMIVYFTQFTSWNGIWSLYEQHAFLVPVPFFGG
jgi:hypothetical protein